MLSMAKNGDRNNGAQKKWGLSFALHLYLENDEVVRQYCWEPILLVFRGSEPTITTAV